MSEDTKRPRKRVKSFATQLASDEGQRRSFAPPPGSGKSSAGAAVGKEVAKEPVNAFTTKDDGKLGDGESGYVPAWKIRHWDLKDRTVEALEDDPSYEDLKAEVRLEGVLESIIVRALPSPDENGCEWEEFAGFKRLSAAMDADPQMLVPIIVRNVDDEKALRIQRSENKGRSDVPYWAQATMLVRVMEKHGIESRAELARKTGYKRELGSMLVRIGQAMPEDFIKCLKLNRLSFEALRLLVKVVEGREGSDYEEAVDRVVEQADTLNDKPERAVRLLTNLIEALESKDAAGKKQAMKPAKAIYHSQKGKTFSTSRDSKKAVFTIHEAALDAVSLDEVEDAIKKMIQDKGLALEKRGGR